MGSRGEQLGRILAAWVSVVSRAPYLTTVAALVVTGLLFTYTARNLGISTDNSEMFAEDVEFRLDYDDFKRNFPQFVDTLLVVVDGETAGTARMAAERLAQRCSSEPEVFRSVHLPGSQEYFRENGLLFLPLEDLEVLESEISVLAPFFAVIQEDPSLARLLDVLGKAAAIAGERLPPRLALVLDGVSSALESREETVTAPFPWRDAIAGTSSELLGTRQLLLLQPVMDFSALLPGETAIERVRELCGELGLRGADSGVSVRMTGEVFLAHEELESAKAGATLAGILSIVVVFVLLAIGLGSARMVFASLVTLFLGLIWTAGYATFAVGHLNLISIAFAVLYISLGVEYSIHFCLRYRELWRAGDDHEESLLGAARSVGSSLFLAAVTTSIGFLAFVPTDFAGVAELGIIAGGGMLISFAANLTVLPALLSLEFLRPERSGRPISLFGAHSATFLDFPTKHAPGVRFGALGLFVVALPTLYWVRFDPDPLHLREQETESVSTFQMLADSSRTTPYRVSVLADAADEELLRAQLASLESVEGVVSLRDYVPADQGPKLDVLSRLEPLFPVVSREVPPPDPDVAATRASAESLASGLEKLFDAEDASLALIARRLAGNLQGLVTNLESSEDLARDVAALERLVLDGLLDELDGLARSVRTHGATEADLPPEIAARWIAPDGRRRVEVLPSGALTELEAIRTFVGEVRAVRADATGGPVIIVEAGRVAVSAFQRAFLYALISIVVVLFLLFRDLRDVALVVAPLVLAGVLTGAAAIAFGLAFNFANVIALPLLLGVGVDSGIFMVHRQRSAAPMTGNILHTSTARAVLFSSLTTVGGFGTLAISPHIGTSSLGQLLTLGIALTLACTLVLLPALLLARRQAAARPAGESPPGDDHPRSFRERAGTPP